MAFLLLWQFASQSNLVNPFLVSTPTDVVQTAWTLLSSGTLNPHLEVSAKEFSQGFALALVIAMPLGLLAGFYRPIYYLIEPFVLSLYATPKVAMLPLVLLWFGIGMESKILFVFLEAFFPLLFNSMAGPRTVERDLMRIADSFGARGTWLFRSLVLPASVPFLLTGVRLAVARGLVGLVLAELYSSNVGIGFFLNYSGEQFQIPAMFTGILLIGLFGVVANLALVRLERRFDRWRPSTSGR